MKKYNNNSVCEEIFNAITHGIGTALGFIGFVFLLTYAVKSQDTIKIIAFGIFGMTGFLMYLMSTLFHSLTFTKAKRVFRILDHSSIFLFIAGTYTPFTILAIKGKLGWIILTFVWIMAVTGIIFKAFNIDNLKISLIFYLMMGWIGIIAFKPLISHLSMSGFILLLSGGVFYTIGTFFYTKKKLLFNHGIWHIFVLAGSLCHFAVIFSL